MRKTKPLEDRLFPRLDVAGPCWLWTGAKNIGGYGAIYKGPGLGTRVVHRVVWEILVGPVPSGTELDHVCRVRICCNPDHLEPVTRAVNVARGSHRAGAPRGDACRRGHPFDESNTARQPGGSRLCRACSNAANRRSRARQKENR